MNQVSWTVRNIREKTFSKSENISDEIDMIANLVFPGFRCQNVGEKKRETLKMFVIINVGQQKISNGNQHKNFPQFIGKFSQ